MNGWHEVYLGSKGTRQSCLLKKSETEIVEMEVGPLRLGGGGGIRMLMSGGYGVRTRQVNLNQKRMGSPRFRQMRAMKRTLQALDGRR